MLKLTLTNKFYEGGLKPAKSTAGVLTTCATEAYVIMWLYGTWSI